MKDSDFRFDKGEDARYQLELYRASGMGGVCTVLLDEELTLLYGNDIYFKMHGGTAEEMTGQSCAALIHPDDEKFVRALLDAAKEPGGGKSPEWEMRIVTKTGAEKYVLVSGRVRKQGDESVLNCYIIDVTKQKQTEKALLQSEEKFRVATENSDISFWTYDFGKREIHNTPSSRKEHRDEEFVYNVPDSIIADGFIRKDSVEAFREMYRKLREGAKTASGDFWFKRQGGGWWCEHIDYTNVFDEHGKPAMAYALGKDVTEAKNAEKRYREAVDYAKATQSSNLLAKVRANVTQNTVEDYSAKEGAAVGCSGMSYDRRIEELAKCCLTDEDRAEILRSMNRKRVLKVFEEGYTSYSVEYRRVLDDGSLVWANTTVKTYKNPETGDVMSFLYSYDVNDRKVKDGIIGAVTALEYDYIAYIDLIRDRYNIYFGSGEAGELVPQQNKNYEQSVYDVNSKLVVPEDADRAIADMLPSGIRKNLKDQRVFSTVYTVYEGEGEARQTRQKRVQYAYLDEAGGQVVLTRTDVTEVLRQQKQQQDTLEAALLAAKQANSAKSDFLSRMSHEIRTPMNAIIGMSAIAAQSIGDDEQVADCISKIGISSRFLLSLINDILDMSRIESGKMLLKNENISFSDFISGVNAICYPQAKAKNIDYECTVAPDVEENYIGDAMKLQQVIVNILANAVKFTPEGGRIFMNVSQTKRVRDNALVRFSINDTGCGISEEFIPHLFEPFAQENTVCSAGGTGLGLAICKNIVDMMNGSIRVRSIVGVGSEFTVEVNLGVAEEAKRRPAVKTPCNFADIKALVVDDDVTVCRYAEITLESMGVRSEWVDSGRRAVELVEERFAAKNDFDLVLLDWKMPDMDGIETAREIRKIVGPEVTIIIMTAYDWSAIEQEAKLAGVNMLMSKPMLKSSLISAFEKVFGDKEEEKQQKQASDYDFTGKRVLIAEDHPLNVEVATRLLEHRGFAVEQAENGLRALEMFTTTPVGYYDAILMDIRMPQMDGLQAASNIRHCRKEDARTVPIVAMTANAFEDDAEKSKAAGMNAHLAKPIEPELLYQTLERLIEQR